MASPPTIHSLWHGKCGLTHHKFCRQTTFKEGKGGSSNFFRLAPTWSRFRWWVLQGLWIFQEMFQHWNSSPRHPAHLAPTFDTHLFTAIHQKHWSPKYPILSFLAPLVRTSWISHHGQHNLFLLALAIAIFFQYACRTMMGQQNFWRGAKRKY